jgi:phospholipid-binding lipoprotein MlaA
MTFARPSYKRRSASETTCQQPFQARNETSSISLERWTATMRDRRGGGWEAWVRRVLMIVTVGLVFAASAPATTALAAASAPVGEASSPPASQDDPWQGLNRVGFAIHQFLDRVILRPAALAYRRLTPGPARQGVRNMLDNLGEPGVTANDILQGRFRSASVSVARFATNSTVGVLGLFDVAGHLGAPRHDNNFALTLGRAHVSPGPYLFVPLIGPTTVRDLIGATVDVVLDPLHWTRYRYSTEISVARAVANGLDKRQAVDDQLEALLSDATDPYATLRSVYLQSQQNKIDGGAAAALPALPDFPDQPDTPPPAPAPAPPAPAPAPPSPAPAPAPVQPAADQKPASAPSTEAQSPAK